MRVEHIEKSSENAVVTVKVRLISGLGVRQDQD